jgi:hypothetical protein
MGLMIMKSMVAHQVIKEGVGNWNEWVADIYTRAQSYLISYAKLYYYY